MKAKRFISILMTMVMMLSVAFCVVPTASAATKRLPTVRFVTTIDGRNVSRTHNLYQFKSYNVESYLMVGSKKVYDVEVLNCLGKTVVKTSNSKSVFAGSRKLYVNKGNNKKVKINVSRRVTDSYKQISDIYDRLTFLFYTKDEALAIRNYLLLHCGKTISSSFYVNPMPFKAKVDYVRAHKGHAHVDLECLTPFDSDTFTFLNNKEFKFWDNTYSIDVHINHPTSKTLCKVQIKNSFIGKVVHAIKVAPCNLARYGYVLSGK